MSDLIRREDALDAINHICPVDTEYDCALLDRADVRCVLSDLPSAEPEQVIKIGQRSGKTLESAIDYLQSTGWLQEHDRILTQSAEPERKKGKWIRVGHWRRSYKCNQCGNYLDFDGVNAGRGDANFCPHCGADMRGE